MQFGCIFLLRQIKPMISHLKLVKEIGLYGDHLTRVPMPCGHSASLRYIFIHLCESFHLW